MTRYCFYAFLAAAIANYLCSLQILRELSGAGVRIGAFELRWQVHKHLKTYRELSLQRDGHVSLHFYAYWASLFGMVLFGLCALLFLDA